MQNKNLKIAHVVSSLAIGGAERFVVDLTKDQNKSGHCVDIISFGREIDELVSVCEQLDITTFTISGANKLVKVLKFIKLSNNYDIVHFHSPYPLKFVSLFLRFIKSKIVYTRHGANPLKEKAWVKMHQRVNAYVDAITFVSQEGANIFHVNHGWKNKQLHVIDNGVEVDLDFQPNRIKDKLRIGSVGRMVELKGQIDLLRMAKNLPLKQQEKIEIHFYGDGPCFDVLQQYWQSEIPDINVVFHGMVTDRTKIYGEIDVLVVTSETEGLSLAIIEAMAFGNPAIGTNVGGTPKLIVDDETGWLFEYQDIDTLREHIQKLLAQPELINILGKQAQQKMHQAFSISSTARKYDDIYKTVIQGS